MSLTSFYSALTGLNNNAFTINVIGANLANINTTAFKASKTSFSELLGGLSGSTDSGNPIQVGLGSYISSISQIFKPGTITYTGKATDAAINGNGFFVVSTGEGLGFTRSGSFGFTETGELINSEGFKVLGYPAVNGAVNPGGALSPILIQKGGSLAPKATTDMSVIANLDSQAADGSTFVTAVQIYDSLGTTHVVTMTYTKNGANTWDWDATLPAADIAGGTPGGTPVSIGSGSFTFDGSGVLTAPTSNATLTISNLASGAADMDVNFNILDSRGKPQFTGYAAPSTVSATAQNGYAASTLKEINIESSGVISGVFDNGQVQSLAQLALANFPNVEGLLKFKGSTYVGFQSSGEPSIGVAGSGGRGTISGSALEQSNVDIAQEFTNLIIAQRGYQANSRIITTTDELYQESINLKR